MNVLELRGLSTQQWQPWQGLKKSRGSFNGGATQLYPHQLRSHFPQCAQPSSTVIHRAKRQEASRFESLTPLTIYLLQQSLFLQWPHGSSHLEGTREHSISSWPIFSDQLQFWVWPYVCKASLSLLVHCDSAPSLPPEPYGQQERELGITRQTWAIYRWYI